MNNIIYEKPVREVISDIDDKEKSSILLVGDKSSGKSTVLNKYLELNDYFAINMTLEEESMLNIRDTEVFKLYHVCLLIQKMIKWLYEYYPVCTYYLGEYETNIKIILFNIENMYMVDMYDKKYKLFGEEICSHPEILLDEFIKELKKRMDFNSLELVIDNFDVVGRSSSRYQLYIYELLKNRIRTIYSVSDTNTINEKGNILLKDNDIVSINYSKDPVYVKKILDSMIFSNLVQKGYFSNKRVIYLLNNELVELLINLTNGNINEMYNIVAYLYKNKDIIGIDNFKKFIIEYYNERQSLLEEYFEEANKRKLYL